MSEFVHVVVDVIGEGRKQVKAFADSVASSSSPLIGSRVSRKWVSPAIEDLRFDIRSLTDRQGRIRVRARYRFDSRGFGGGIGGYFRDASRRHPKLQFVEYWIYPDEDIGEVGRQEFVAGEVVREEVQLLSDDRVRFRKLAWRWLRWSLPEGYPDH